MMLFTHRLKSVNHNLTVPNGFTFLNLQKRNTIKYQRQQQQQQQQRTTSLNIVQHRTIIVQASTMCAPPLPTLLLLTTLLFFVPPTQSSEKKLIDYLLTDYSPLSRPVRNASDAVVVTFGFELNQIAAVIESEQTIEIKVKIK